MTQEERQELLVALCGYLPYGLKFKTFKYTDDGNKVITVNTVKAINYNTKQIQLDTFNNWSEIDWWKPYLRLMSSMTEEERNHFLETCVYSRSELCYQWTCKSYDWLNAHHFDYRGLIEKGLALEAPEGMYNFKNN